MIDTSVIVVSYNSRPYLRACIDSIRAQLSGQDELIIVDNGSTDGSAELVQTEYPDVKLIVGENVGYAGGNNRGAAIARGQYLVFLNPDTVLAPLALLTLVDPLRRPGRLALTTPCIVHMNRPDIVNACGNTVHFTGLAYCHGAGKQHTTFTCAQEVDAVSGAAFAIRRTVFDELEGFDERFFMYVEDTDLSWRARLAGYTCQFVSDALVQHDYRPTYSPQKAFFLDRNRHMMLLKNLGWGTYARLIPALLLAELVTWGFLLLKGPRYWPVKFRVYRWLWCHREVVRQARSRTQHHRTQGDRAILQPLTHRLEFAQLATPLLSLAAATMFHPTFWLAKQLAIRGQA